MKKVRLNTTMAGPAGVFPAGSVLDVDDKEAKLLVDGGFAVLLGEETENVGDASDNKRASNARRGKKTSSAKSGK